MIIAAAMRGLGEQQAAAEGPPPAEPPVWPWTAYDCARRVEEARELLGAPKPRIQSGVASQPEVKEAS